jgi:hypothetical protein
MVLADNGSGKGWAAVTERPSSRIVDTLRTTPRPACAAAAAARTSPTQRPVKHSLSHPAAARADAQ